MAQVITQNILMTTQPWGVKEKESMNAKQNTKSESLLAQLQV